MLNLIGDILNWTAAGIVFPVLFLPLAILVTRRGQPLLTWLTLVIAIVIACGAFAHFTPVLSITPSITKTSMFGGALLLATLVIALSGGAEKVAATLTFLFDQVTRSIGRTVMWLLLVMALVQFGIVVLRYVFGINFIFMQESITYMHGAVFLLAGGYALLTDDHVRVDIFYRDATPRRKALIDLAGTYLLLFPICLLLLWTASPYVANSWSVGEGSNESSGIKGLFILKSFIPAFAMLLAMAGFVIASRASAILREPR